MAFQTGTSASIDNLMSILSTFLTANGWTQDHFTAGDPGRAGFSKNSIFAAFQWTDASVNGALAIYQNTSNDDAANVWLSTGDTGIGTATTTATSFNGALCVNEFAGPHTAYWFFEQDANPAYVHIVVEVDAGRFRHFGFGEIEKVGDWVGGEYVYGHYWSQSVNFIDVPTSTSHAFGLDNAISVTNFRAAAMRMKGFPQQLPAEEWALVTQGGFYPAGTDRAGNNRMPVLGSWRGGLAYQHMSMIPLSTLSAFKPLAPLIYAIKDTSPNPNEIILLGSHADVRGINMANVSPGETFTIAGETWYAFPWVRKQFLNNNTEESWNGGMAYRRENA